MARRKARSGGDRGAEADALDELYLESLEDFVGRRNELAKRLRAEGDEEAAERVRALKKPTRVAWAIDRFSAREQDLRGELLAAGAALRTAQEQLIAGKATSADVREATKLERAAVARALDAVSALARDGGADLSPAALDRARQTLHAVALDEDVRREFESHRLITDHEAAGLGGLSPGAVAPARTGGGKGQSGRDEPKRRREQLKAAEAQARTLEQRRRDAERDAEAARQAAERAQGDLKRATKELDEAAAEAAAAHERVDGLRERWA